MSDHGEHRRDRALALVGSRHAERIAEAQLAMLEAMRGRLDRTGTSDDCTPAETRHSGNAPWLGAAVRSLAERKLIECIGMVRSTRPSRKGNLVRRWRLRDDASADAMMATLRGALDAHRPIDNPAPDDTGPSLFEN